MVARSSLASVPFSAVHSPAPDLKIVIVGHVDHGKSTLVGRLLHETHALPEGKLEQIKASCDKRGMPFEWSFCMDALQAERDQNVTIDTTQIWFSSAVRRYCLIDAPGHREFLKNMITGAASADAALLLIDAQEGIKEQSRRHAYLLHLLGITQVVVVINKMDLVGYSQATYDAVVAEYDAYLRELGIIPAAYIPVSARDGDHLVTPSASMKWAGTKTLLGALDAFAPAPREDDAPLRLWVQDVYRFDARRMVVGSIESGALKLGDRVTFLPSGVSSTIRSLEQWPQTLPKKTQAISGESVALTLDDPIFVERGHLMCHNESPAAVVNQFTTRLFWLHAKPLVVGANLRLKLGTLEVKARVVAIQQVLDTETLVHSTADQVQRLQVAEVIWHTKTPMPMDVASTLPRTGRVVLFDGYDVAGGGIVVGELNDVRAQWHRAVKSTHITAVTYDITPKDRAVMNGHKGGVLWFTGLSGSGKSTLAKELQQQLFAKGYQVYVLDGDNIRSGLCSDLGFSPEDRTENIRRIGEVAALFADAGFIVITAFISPYRADRQRASAVAPEHFNTIYIAAGVEACEKRDAKGLYRKARAGEIKDFTGISAPYEPPADADLTIDTETHDVAECVNQLIDYVKKNFDYSGKAVNQ